MHTPRTAFVLTGGASHGAVQVGMLRALTARGVRPDFLVGVSIGAVNAAYFAGDASSEGVRRLERIWLRLRRADVFPAIWAQAVRSFLRRRGYMIDPMPLRRFLEQHIPYRRLEEARVPCHVIAADAADGSGVRLSTGSVVDALLASAAIPGVFPPVRVGDRLLVDGIAAAGRSPVTAAVTLGATRIIVLPTTGHAPALAAAGAANIAIVPPLPAVRTSVYDFSRSADLIERAAESTEQWLAVGGHQFPDAAGRSTTCELRAA